MGFGRPDGRGLCPWLGPSYVYAFFGLGCRGNGVEGFSMPQLSRLRRELKEMQKIRITWPITIIGICASACTTFLFAHYGRLELALPIMNFIGLMTFIIFFKWNLRRKLWFWIAIAIIAIFHVILLLLIPWSTEWVPALAIAAVVSVDACLILGFLIAAERLAGGSTATEK
jgi:hypothetical protein